MNGFHNDVLICWQALSVHVDESPDRTADEYFVALVGCRITISVFPPRPRLSPGAFVTSPRKYPSLGHQCSPVVDSWHGSCSKLSRRFVRETARHEVLVNLQSGAKRSSDE